MGEDVLRAPTCEVEQGARRQEIEAGLGDPLSALARQHLIELRLQGMEMEDVGGGVAELLVGELRRTPIGGLLLLRELDAEEFATEILEAVAIGEGAGKPRCDLGAVHRPRRDAQIAMEDGDVEAAEMENLQYLRIAEQRLETRRL